MDLVGKIIRKVEATIARYRMIEPGERVVAAVSGGADSVCLVDVLCRLQGPMGMTLTVAHFDHGLRPEADELETRFVGDLAASLNLPVVVGKADPPMDPMTPSLEERAREARYRFFKECRNSCGAGKIATGHTLNDQAETVLLRLLRGSGPAGLSGIPPVREDGVIRPLIQVSRAEIDAYLREAGLPHVTDASNAETSHLRNEIRHHLLPRLRDYQPNIVALLGRTADLLREESGWMDDQAMKWLSRWAAAGPEGYVIPLSRFRELPEALKGRVVREVLRRVSGTLRRIGADHVRAVKGVVETTRPQSVAALPFGLTVRKAYDKLLVSKGPHTGPGPYCCLIEGTGSFVVDALGCRLTLEETEPPRDPKTLGANPWTAYVDADRMVFPLMVRNPRPGDRLIPLGMTGHQKVKDLFVNLKIPSDIRSRIPVLAQRQGLIWVCGLRIDDRFKVTLHTRRVLKIAFQGVPPILPSDHRGP